MIVTCPNCRKSLKAPDNAAGKKVRCPGCLEIIAVPAEGGAGGGSAAGSSSATKPATKPKPPSAASAPPSTASPGRSTNRSSAAESKPTTTSDRRSASTSAGSAAGAQSGTPARPKSKPPSTTSGTGASSKPSKRPKREDPADYDDYGSGYESGGVDPWSSGPSWEEPNPYAAPTSDTSTRRRKKSTGSGSLKLAGIGLLVQAWSYIAIIVTVFSIIAVGVIVAVARSGGGGGVGPGEVGVMFAGVGALLLIPMGIAILVGLVLCVFVPAKTGAQMHMIVTLCLTVVLGLFVIVRTFGSSADDVPIVGFALEFIRMLLQLAQEVFFCLFMRASANHVRRDDLARMANVVMYGFSTVSLLTFLGGLVLALLAGAVPQAIPVVGFLGGGLILLAAIVFWFMQLFLMFRLGTAMKNY